MASTKWGFRHHCTEPESRWSCLELAVKRVRHTARSDEAALAGKAARSRATSRASPGTQSGSQPWSCVRRNLGSPLPSHLVPPARAVGLCAAALVAQQGNQRHVGCQHEGAGQADERHPANVAWRGMAWQHTKYTISD